MGIAMNANNHVPPVMHIPPPLWFAAAFFAGWGLQLLVPLTVHSPTIVLASRAMGFGLLVCGGLIALSCFVMFLLARTTVIPFGRASSLVTRGPYRFTRNPMYLSLVLSYLGGVGLLVLPWALVFLPVPLAILNWVVIPFEERRLREAFDGEYAAYCEKVHRWI